MGPCLRCLSRVGSHRLTAGGRIPSTCGCGERFTPREVGRSISIIGEWGSSDPVPQERLGDLDEWVDDVVAVLDAIDVERVSMMAELEQAAVAIRLATRHPERVERIAFTYPLLRLPPSVTEMVPMVLQEWGTGRCLQALGLTGDLDFLARSERRAASRASAAAVLRAIGRWDVSPDVERVQAECLVMSILSHPAGALSRACYPTAPRTVGRGEPNGPVLGRPDVRADPRVGRLEPRNRRAPLVHVGAHRHRRLDVAALRRRRQRLAPDPRLPRRRRD